MWILVSLIITGFWTQGGFHNARNKCGECTGLVQSPGLWARHVTEDNRVHPDGIDEVGS